MRVIRFRFAAQKAKDALHWMAACHPKIDLHTALKACYFADRRHLNAHLRPVFGATYRAMKFGPVPLEIYEMAKGENIWLAELDIEKFPWRLDGFRLSLVGNEPPYLNNMSDEDQVSFKAGLAESVAMTFNERTAATHGPDWQAAELGNMRYEDMLIDTPDKAERIRHLQENARFLRL